uniref:Uncharacterized protein n=1 Tax=Siphoviridae sp. ctRcp9 TaxID=2825504 RepID=A0A8S5PJR1_9CAUD|nr:MAG TPA: hypothetical protein [Siphoviridae sp. ctRcp9]
MYNHILPLYLNKYNSEHKFCQISNIKNGSNFM